MLCPLPTLVPVPKVSVLLFVSLLVALAWGTAIGWTMLAIGGFLVASVAGMGLPALVGAALATAGAMLQSLLRNPLADPYVLGVSGGAAVGALGALVLGAALFSAMGRFQSLEYGYRIERLEKDKKTALETNRKLQLEEASLGDPTRIDWIARNELGMKTLAPDQIYRAEAEPSTAVAVNSRTESAPVLTARNQLMRDVR